MARVNISVVQKVAGSACDREDNPRACRRGIAHAIESFKEQKGQKMKKRKANPAAAARLNEWRKCASRAGVAPFTKPTSSQKNEIDRCLGRR
jgi:hypothetical protein